MGFKPRVVGGTNLKFSPPDIFNTRFTGFKPQVVGEDNATTGNALDQISTEDPLENIDGDFVDSDFNIRIHQILETVESLEYSTGGKKDRQATWNTGRVEHGIRQMTDAQLKDVVMRTDISMINIKPSYFTALCGEIIERVIGSVPRIK